MIIIKKGYANTLRTAGIGHNNLTYTHTLFQWFLKRCNRAFFFFNLNFIAPLTYLQYIFYSTYNEPQFIFSNSKYNTYKLFTGISIYFQLNTSDYTLITPNFHSNFKAEYKAIIPCIY